MFSHLFTQWKKRKSPSFVETIELKPMVTKRIEKVKNDPYSLRITQEDKGWRPFLLKIEKKNTASFYEQLEELRLFCSNQGHSFFISPMVNDRQVVKKRHLGIVPKEQEQLVVDIDLFVNEYDEIDSFALGRRRKFYAFSGKAPRLISRTPLSEFHQVITYLKKNL